MQLIGRSAEEAVRRALADTRVVVINGARQVGKSTLARMVASRAPGARLLSLDDPIQLSAARDDPITFLRHPGLTVIDEVQREPELLLAIKRAVDEDPTPGRYLLTGSAHVLQVPRIADSLAGRMEIVELWPFSQRELRGGRERFIDALFEDPGSIGRSSELAKEDYLAIATRGGFPEVVARSTDEARERWFSAYIESSTNRDIRELAEVERVRDVETILRVIAARTARLSNHDAIARETGVPQTTVRRYTTLLQTMFLIDFLPAWSSNMVNRVTRSPKIHITDSGLASFLLGKGAAGLQRDGEIGGQVLESFVWAELRRQAGWAGLRTRLHHFRTRGGDEVDIVLEAADGRIAGVEVKSSATPRARDFAGLRLLRSHFPDRFVAGILLYPGRDPVPFGERLWALPMSCLWTT